MSGTSSHLAASEPDAPLFLDTDMMEPILREARPWEQATFTQVRNQVLKGLLLVIQSVGKAPEIGGAQLADKAMAAVQAGRAFDLGHMPNATIQTESKRAGPLFNLGHIGHPFRADYVLFHSWEEGSSLYYVDPAAEGTKGDPKDGYILAEFAAMASRTLRFLLCTSAGKFYADPADPARWHGRLLRDLGDSELDEIDEQKQRALRANLQDPFATALLLLSTDGIEVERIEPPDKLNKARVKNGKAPLPGHYRVATADYITAITGRRQRGGDGQGGHHASPQPHLRRGHLRHKHERHGGGTVWVRDALVLIKDGVELPPTRRAFYRVQTEKPRK